MRLARPVYGVEQGSTPYSGVVGHGLRVNFIRPEQRARQNEHQYGKRQDASAV